jgi:hypothetical protein
MKDAKKYIFLVAIVTLFLFSSALADPLIGGFSVDTPLLNISAQPYKLYYYPGITYEAQYALSGKWMVGAGFTFGVPWMNFSQIPLKKDEIPIALALAKAESGFQNYSRSRVGAEGLMQFMPTTAAEYKIQNAFNPYQTVPAALNYISKYETRFSSLKLAFASYNAGPGAVAKYKGVPPYPETQKYVEKVMKYVKEYSENLIYPEIYARVGIFAEYRSPNEAIIGISYPLPPGQVDLCPEVTFNSTKVSFSWIWRINVDRFKMAFKHADNGDELEISSIFGPLTAIIGMYQEGVAASGILDLWGEKLFGSISASGDVRYGLALNVFDNYIEAWKDKTGYVFSLNGRW